MGISKFFKKKSEETASSVDSQTASQVESSADSQTAASSASTVDTQSTTVSGESVNAQTQGRNVKIHNLIILDESGSMLTIYQPALTGVNETLQTIRSAQEEHPEQEHYVTLVAFDTGHFNYIYDHAPAQSAIDITQNQYRPNGGTPLFDAMGKAINDLRAHIADEDVVLVTIITDGYENSSTEYVGTAIKALVEQMKKAGWVFTYIGANQDVMAVAESLSIKNALCFSATENGTREMFAKERSSRKKFYGKASLRKQFDISEDYFDN